MLKKSGISIEEAFEKACKENDIIFNKADKNSKADEITLVDSKGRNFKVDKNLKVVDISEWNPISLQSLQKKEIRVIGGISESSDLYMNEPLYLKTADDTHVALVALGPQVNKAVRVYDNEGIAFDIPYLTIKNKIRKHKSVKNNISGRKIQNKKKDC